MNHRSATEGQTAAAPLVSPVSSIGFSASHCRRCCLRLSVIFLVNARCLFQRRQAMEHSRQLRRGAYGELRLVHDGRSPFPSTEDLIHARSVPSDSARRTGSGSAGADCAMRVGDSAGPSARGVRRVPTRRVVCAPCGHEKTRRNAYDEESDQQKFHGSSVLGSIDTENIRPYQYGQSINGSPQMPRITSVCAQES